MIFYHNYLNFISAIAMLREPSPRLDEDNIVEHESAIIEPEQSTSNRTLPSDLEDDVIFVSCQQAPPNRNVVIDLSTPDTALDKQSKRRRRSRLLETNDAPTEVVNINDTPSDIAKANISRLDIPFAHQQSNRNEFHINCAICLDACRKPTSTLCGHVFCEKCIKAAIASSHKCPLCKRKLSSKGIHPLFL